MKTVIFLAQYVVNSPAVTAWGTYRWTPLTLEEAREWMRRHPGTDSAVGQQAAADFLTGVLGAPVPMNRVQITMGDQGGEYGEALVLRLRTRLPEGKVLSLEEMKAVDCQFGLLTYGGP